MSREFLIACILLLAIKSCQYRQAHAYQVVATVGLERQYCAHKNLFTNAMPSPIIVNKGTAYQFRRLYANLY